MNNKKCLVETIDYDLILTELKKGLRSEYHPVVKLLIPQMVPELYYREFRTVALGTPRQTGAKSWVIKCIRRDPTAIVVFASDALSDVTRRFHVEHDHERRRIYGQMEFQTAIRKEEMRPFKTVFLFDSNHMAEHTFHLLYDHLHSLKQSEPLIVRVK